MQHGSASVRRGTSSAVARYSSVSPGASCSKVAMVSGGTAQSTVAIWTHPHNRVLLGLL
jgi:hypothetical protein